MKGQIKLTENEWHRLKLKDQVNNEHDGDCGRDNCVLCRRLYKTNKPALGLRRKQ